MYELIDHFGTPQGYCLFIDLIEPGSLTLQEAVRPMHWHMKVLYKGKIEYRDTSITSLIELPYELVNQDNNP
jgi:hypothetical protein